MMRNKDEMLILGLTGGIGCGKTAVLTILKEEYDAYIIEADRLAHELKNGLSGNCGCIWYGGFDGY